MLGRPYPLDRRRFPRFDCNFTVWCRIEEPWYLRRQFQDDEFEATTINLSAGGVGLLSEHNVAPNTALCLTFVLFKENNPGELRWRKPLQVRGRVCYSLSTEDNRFRLGLCFTEVPTEYSQELSDFLAAAAA